MKQIFISLIITLSAVNILAHGEDKPGPHGGHIKMPANFHTEVISDKDGSFHVYLLDIQFQNPTVKDSEIKAYVMNGKKKANLKCSVMGTNHFHCKGSKPAKTGSLILKAKREGTWASMDAKYDLPLKSFDAKPEINSPAPAQSEDHSKHH